MRIAMLGTRGVPARYGGFETAIEEIGSRLAAAGHDVTVYSRRPTGAPPVEHHRGMTVVELPAIRTKSLETLSHSAASVGHTVTHRTPDAAFVFNAANAIYLPALRSRRIPVATHVDGLEWRRAKWGGNGRRFYRLSESLAVRYSDQLIADAPGIARYYQDEFGAGTVEIAYGAPLVADRHPELLPPGITPFQYHLVVARFEPENHILEILRGYSAAGARHPLVVVGSAPYAEEYSAAIRRTATPDSGIMMLGGVWDQEQLDQLYANALSYVHGHSVGGTNPSLLRAMGAGTAVAAWDVSFNRDVAGSEAGYFGTEDDLGHLLRSIESDPQGTRRSGAALQQRARSRYDWDAVAGQYERLADALRRGRSQRGRVSGRRNPSSGWHR